MPVVIAAGIIDKASPRQDRGENLYAR